jgi:hypothetical protein
MTVSLSTILNEFYGEKPVQWSEREYEEIDFTEEIQALNFTPAALVIVTKVKHNHIAPYAHEWHKENTRSGMRSLWANANTMISYIIAFEDASEAALFKLNFCC